MIQTVNNQPKVAIIGAGIIGLATSVQLIQAGYTNIQIYAKEVSPYITSDVAAAIWDPYKAYPEHLVNKWAVDSLTVLKSLMLDPAAGISWLPLITFFKENIPMPAWMSHLELCRHQIKMPLGFSSSYAVNTLLVHSELHLKYLLAKLKDANVNIQQTNVHDIDSLVSNNDIVINCAGLGSRELLDDKEVYPIYGEVAVFSKPQNLKYSILTDDPSTYIFVRPKDCIVGGVAKDHCWDKSIDHVALDEVLERAYALCPELVGAEMQKVKVGLRPGRKEVRLELQQQNGKALIHNYGHGGAGFTLAWGCALEVQKLVEQYCN